jgi:hypothetical protein
MEEVMALPELSTYEYEGIQPRDGKAYVCSAFVVSMF